MGRHQTFKTEDAAFVLQDAIDASDVIGRWEYDVQNDRACADAMVAMVFNVDPLLARSGTSIDVFLAGVHPEDRERTTRQFERHVQSGGCWVFEYRVCSADGVIRWIVDRGRITHDAEGRPIHGDGVLVDVTRMREEERSGDLEDPTAARHPLERAAEHCLRIPKNHPRIAGAPPAAHERYDADRTRHGAGQGREKTPAQPTELTGVRCQ